MAPKETFACEPHSAGREHEARQFETEGLNLACRFVEPPTRTNQTSMGHERKDDYKNQNQPAANGHRSGLAATAARCAKKTPNAIRAAVRGVNLTLTATIPVKIERLVLNAHTGDERCDSAASPSGTNGEFDQEVHKVPVNLRTGEQISIRWNPSCGAIYKAKVTTDEDVYNLNFIGGE
jgi:hypothetical protein